MMRSFLILETFDLIHSLLVQLERECRQGIFPTRKDVGFDLVRLAGTKCAKHAPCPGVVF